MLDIPHHDVIGRILLGAMAVAWCSGVGHGLALLRHRAPGESLVGFALVGRRMFDPGRFRSSGRRAQKRMRMSFYAFIGLGVVLLVLLLATMR